MPIGIKVHWSQTNHQMEFSLDHQNWVWPTANEFKSIVSTNMYGHNTSKNIASSSSFLTIKCIKMELSHLIWMKAKIRKHTSRISSSPKLEIG